jgi:hypothetical protein
MYLLCIRRTCGVGFYSASSPKQQSRDTLTETTVKRYTHRNNSQEIHSPKQQSRDTLRPTCIYYHDPEQTSSEFILSYRRSNKHNNFIVFGLTRPGFEPTIYRNRGDHANYYTTEAITLTITQPRRSR